MYFITFGQTEVDTTFGYIGKIISDCKPILLLLFGMMLGLFLVRFIIDFFVHFVAIKREKKELERIGYAFERYMEIHEIGVELKEGEEKEKIRYFKKFLKFQEEKLKGLTPEKSYPHELPFYEMPLTPTLFKKARKLVLGK